MLLRIFMRAMNLLDPPDELMKNPAVLQRVLASYARRDQRDRPDLGPTREAMVARFAALAAPASRTAS